MRWIIGFTILILIVGVVSGVLMGGLNPWQNPAEAERIRINTAHQAAMNALQEQMAQAKTEADIQFIQRAEKMLDAQNAHDIQALAQDLENRRTSFNTWMTILTFFAGAISISIIIVTCALAIPWLVQRTHRISNAKEPAMFNISVLSPKEREEKAVKEYWHERCETTRQKETRMRAAANPAAMEKDQYNKLPHAE
jgi:hypothetical protein